MLAHCRQLKKNKNKKKIKKMTKKNIQQHQQQQQKRCTKKTIYAYWPIAAKMTTSTQFPTKDVLTPHRYKRL